MAEVNSWVGELGSQETVHDAVIVRHVQEAPEHVNRLVVFSINLLESFGVGQKDVDHNVLGSMRLEAFVD